MRVREAITPADLRDVLHVRHQVFVDEGGFLADQGGAIVDLYDALPTTSNLAAVVGDSIVGGLRATLDSEAGMPADAFFDFRAVVPHGARLASGSMLCMRQSNRHAARLLVGLFRMCVYWAHVRGVTHLCAPINPKVRPMMERIGLTVVGEQFTDAKGLPTLPMVLDLASMSPDFVDFVARQDVGLRMDSFERAFFEEGDEIVTRGDPGDEAFLVVMGAAEALDDLALPVQRFEPGDVFGELALLVNRPRTSTVVARGSTDVMVLKRDVFEQQLQTRTELALSLMRSLGRRFYDSVTAT